mgnify:CR=1 FL=1
MKIHPARFNTYLLVAALVAGIAGCQTPSKKKELSTLRVHIEVTPDGTGANQVVPVFREQPVRININKSPFLTELHVASAQVVESLGGYAIQIQFNRSGTWLLEQYSLANKGRRMVIFSQFGDGPDQARWLAAPLIRQGITNGFLVFTPDASRDEAERIVRGLNNLVAQNKQKGL